MLKSASIVKAERSFCCSLGIPKNTNNFFASSIFKSSFDKGNRTSHSSFRGPGIDKGLRILADVKQSFNIPITTDIHSASQANTVGEIVDIIQIPAFLCRQSDIINAAVKTCKIINVKKGQFMAPWDVSNIIEKVAEGNGDKLLLTERGSSFGYNSLVSDMTSIPIMQDFGVPVIFDATHSVQRPGGLGKTTGGAREFIPTPTINTRVPNHFKVFVI